VAFFVKCQVQHPLYKNTASPAINDSDLTPDNNSFLFISDINPLAAYSFIRKSKQTLTLVLNIMPFIEKLK